MRSHFQVVDTLSMMIVQHSSWCTSTRGISVNKLVFFPHQIESEYQLCFDIPAELIPNQRSK